MSEIYVVDYSVSLLLDRRIAAAASPSKPSTHQMMNWWGRELFANKVALYRGLKYVIVWNTVVAHGLNLNPPSTE